MTQTQRSSTVTNKRKSNAPTASLLAVRVTFCVIGALGLSTLLELNTAQAQSFGPGIEIEPQHQKVQWLDISPLKRNFAFQENKVMWIESPEELKRLWKNYSREIEPTAPQLAVDWQKQKLAAIFWKSVDTLIRQPAFVGMREIATSNEGVKDIEFEFFLTTPCFGLITDVSPSAFFIVNRNFNYRNIEIYSRPAKELKCLGEDAEAETPQTEKGSDGL